MQKMKKNMVKIIGKTIIGKNEPSRWSTCEINYIPNFFLVYMETKVENLYSLDCLFQASIKF